MTSGWRAQLRLPPEISPKILEHDPTTGAILMERLIPGTPLWQSSLSEQEQQEVFLEMAASLPCLSPEGLMPLEDYLDHSSLAKALLDTTATTCFLHGDLHHGNILMGESGWQLIDPKGLVGDPAFEIAAFMRNPVETLGLEPNLKKLLAGRLNRLCNRRKVDPARALGWSIACFSSTERLPDDPCPLIQQTLQELFLELGFGSRFGL